MTRAQHLAVMAERARELSAAQQAANEARAALVAAIDVARESGVRWADVAGVLGFNSPQAAQQWHARGRR